MTPEEAAWLAAAIDGEGNIHLSLKPWPQASVSIFNTNTLFLAKAADLMCGSVGIVRGKRPGRKTLYRARISGHFKVLITLESVLPYLIIKKDKAKTIVDFIKSRKWDKPSSGEARDRQLSGLRAYNLSRKRA